MRPQMLVMDDIEEVFVPLPNGLLVTLAESLDLVKSLLQSLPAMFEKTADKKSALGPAMKAAKGLIANVGGHLFVFQSTLPSVGEGAISRVEDAALKFAR